MEWDGTFYQTFFFFFLFTTKTAVTTTPKANLLEDLMASTLSLQFEVIAIERKILFRNSHVSDFRSSLIWKNDGNETVDLE